MGRNGRIAVLPVTGDSMLPSLREGQLIAVELLPDDPELGDLLVFRQHDYLVVHRFLGPATREDGRPWLRTRGDNVPTLDPVVERSRVRGRVIAFEKDGRWWGLRTGRARAWALAVALHDLSWAAAGVLARAAEARFRRAGLSLPLGGWVASVDRLALAWAHRMLFRPLHRDGRSAPEAFSAPRRAPATTRGTR